jgi:CrcB protein
MDKVLMVAAGGAVGAALRYAGAGWVARLTGAGYMGTLFVNVAGSFLMGILAILLMERFADSWGRAAPFLMTGVLGGFTTFSAFSLDVLVLIERDRWLTAAVYIGASVGLSILGLFAGLILGRSFWT